MLPESLTLEVVTPERQVAHEQVLEVQLPGANGYLGILPGHAPLITELGLGVLSYRKDGATFYLTAIDGFAEVLGDRVIVLAERSETAEEIDADRARKAKDRAEKRLQKASDPDLDWSRASLALQRALLRLQVATKGGATASDEGHYAG